MKQRLPEFPEHAEVSCLTMPLFRSSQSGTYCTVIIGSRKQAYWKVSRSTMFEQMLYLNK